MAVSCFGRDYQPIHHDQSQNETRRARGLLEALWPYGTDAPPVDPFPEAVTARTQTSSLRSRKPCERKLMPVAPAAK